MKESGWCLAWRGVNTWGAPLCQTDRWETSGTTRKKWNDILWSNQSNQEEGRLLTFSLISRFSYVSEIYWKEVGQWIGSILSVNMEQQISAPTEIGWSWIFQSDRTKTGGPSHLTSDRQYFWNFEHNGKHPWSILLLSPHETIPLGALMYSVLSHNSSRALFLNFLLLGFLFSRVCSVGRPAP